MVTKSRTQFRAVPGREQGQLLPWVAFLMVSIIGIAGLSIDLGHAYVVRQELQNAANAAALAASGQVYYSSTTSQANSIATNYSGTDYNSIPGANKPVITPWCANQLMPKGETCTSSSQSNAIKVTESAAVPTLFMRILGMNTLNVQASSTASMQGAANAWNVAIILDATSSMGSWTGGTPASCAGYSSPFACSLAGVETLLGNVDPCSGASACTPSNSNFRVALFTFPT